MFVLIGTPKYQEAVLAPVQTIEIFLWGDFSGDSMSMNNGVVASKLVKNPGSRSLFLKNVISPCDRENDVKKLLQGVSMPAFTDGTHGMLQNPAISFFFSSSKSAPLISYLVEKGVVNKIPVPKPLSAFSTGYHASLFTYRSLAETHAKARSCQHAYRISPVSCRPKLPKPFSSSPAGLGKQALARTRQVCNLTQNTKGIEISSPDTGGHCVPSF